MHNIFVRNPSDSAEATRQTLASLHLSLAYQYVAIGIFGAFFLRNVARALAPPRQPRSSQAAVSPDTEKAGSLRSTTLPHESIVLRFLGAIDTVASTPVWLHRFGPEWTVCRMALLSVIVTLNIAFCLAIDTTLRNPTTAKESLAILFARRCGRMVLANLPILFATMGRNNLVSIFTGCDYQTVRFVHKLLGIHVIIEAIVHVISYTLYFVVQLSLEEFHGEYVQQYFTFGIIAISAFATIALTSGPWLRRLSYEVFLVFHVVCAALVLVGVWLHQPIATSWVYAALGFWAWERLARLTRHVGWIVNRRVARRSPLLQAEASVVSGAIVLSVPFTAPWSAGQHCYISFWGHEFLAKPWLYGQAHPFSIASVPTPASQDVGHTLHFVLRIHGGITKSLAHHISKSTKLSGKETCRLSISTEGPYGSTPHTAQSDAVLLVAGGSGVTHVSSVLGDIVAKVEDGTSPTNSVRLVWVIHHLAQARWLGTILEKLSTRATAVALDLQIDLYVTRPLTPSTGSETSTPVDSPGASSLSLGQGHEKYYGDEGARTVGTRGAVVHNGRPHILEIMRATLARSTGHTAVLACGPTPLVHAVRAAGIELASLALTIEIASFEC